MTNHDVITKLIGPIDPVGDSNIDNKRFENLKVMTELVDKLLFDINQVAIYNADRHEASMKLAGRFAHNFIKEVKEEY